MITVGRVKFVGIPLYFLDRYDRQIAEWAVRFKEIGPVKQFVLREGYFSALSPDEEQGAELIAVKLIAKLSRKGVEISPLTVRDRTLIALHCEKMEKLGVKPKDRLKEPERPWLPFMPRMN